MKYTDEEMQALARVPDPEMELSILTDAISACRDDLRESKSIFVLACLERIAPIALIAPKMLKALRELARLEVIKDDDDPELQVARSLAYDVLEHTKEYTVR